MTIEYSDAEEYFRYYGQQIRINHRGGTLKFMRNNSLDTKFTKEYYISVGDKSMSLTDEQMLALFNHYLKMHDEYETGEVNE